MNIFVDTSAFVALDDKSDQFHQKAKKFISELEYGFILHTTNYIIDETITHLRITCEYNTAVHFGKMIFSSRIHKIHYIDCELERVAFDFFRKFYDQEFSFTDCTSFAVMKRFGLNKVFTFDEDFRIAGFEMLPHL